MLYQLLYSSCFNLGITNIININNLYIFVEAKALIITVLKQNPYA